MKEQVLEIIELFDVDIDATEIVTHDGEDYIFLDFENSKSWASISYHKATKRLTSATVESKDRHLYYQLNVPDPLYELDTEATMIDSYDDYIEKAKSIWTA